MARLNRSQVRRLERAASEDVVLIHLRDGSVKGFDKTGVQAALYLRRLDAALGREPRASEFLDALAIMPEASGIALGFDRLVMLATGAPRIDDVIWTPVPRNRSR